ncbi:hypothetical protein [Jiangella muralis]|uniref:hypothetical protein n=1 Tax=Jiangella muralis TaxID=702383 RepID=UPI0012FB4FDC|nr:hypothetical protein [Jiangella muralis]
MSPSSLSTRTAQRRPPSPSSRFCPSSRPLPVLMLLAVLAAIVLAAADPLGAAADPLGAADAADGNDSFGWGPSRSVWAGFGWLGLVLIAAILLRRRASRRR